MFVVILQNNNKGLKTPDIDINLKNHIELTMSFTFKLYFSVIHQKLTNPTNGEYHQIYLLIFWEYSKAPQKFPRISTNILMIVGKRQNFDFNQRIFIKHHHVFC